MQHTQKGHPLIAALSYQIQYNTLSNDNIEKKKKKSEWSIKQEKETINPKL